MRCLFTISKLVLLIIAATSCANRQLLLTADSGPLLDLIEVDSTYEHIIQPDDKISLSIWNHDDLSMGSVFSIYNSNESFGKWVLIDRDGAAELPKVGRVELAGLTCKEAGEKLRPLFATDINDPIIVVKVLNRRVTLLGEVRTPGTYILDEERNNILQAVGKSQGFLDYADLKHVRFIRNDMSYELNLARMDESMLHQIIVQSGDVIIVPSRRGKALDQKAPTLIPFASALTALALVASIIL